MSIKFVFITFNVSLFFSYYSPNLQNYSIHSLKFVRIFRGSIIIVQKQTNNKTNKQQKTNTLDSSRRPGFGFREKKKKKKKKKTCSPKADFKVSRCSLVCLILMLANRVMSDAGRLGQCSLVHSWCFCSPKANII